MARVQARSQEGPYARSNLSTLAYWPKPLVPFAKGSFKKVYRGYYANGPRKGQECVSKAFIIRSRFKGSSFGVELSVVRRAQEVINDWNAARIIHLPIVLSIPEIWTIWISPFSREQRLVEPFIRNFQKFNNNDGSMYSQGTFWSDALQALSHFSYHRSFGQMVLCDIQGGVYKDKFILSDPAILSSSKSYGRTDLGAAGINQFFAQHRCNHFCNTAWLKPQ